MEAVNQTPPPVVQKTQEIFLDFWESPQSAVNTEQEKRQNYQKFIEEGLAIEAPDIHFIGAGMENLIIANPINPDILIAYDIRQKRSPINAVELYHYHKIAAALFPNNFPRFIAASETSWPVTTRQRVQKGSEGLITHPISQVMETFEELSLPMRFDHNESNFGPGQDGGEYYFDTLQFYDDSWKELDRDKILDWMHSHNFGEQEIKKVTMSINRLQEIGIARDAARFGLESEGIKSACKEYNLDEQRETNVNRLLTAAQKLAQVTQLQPT